MPKWNKESINTITPSANIACRTCLHRLRDVKVAGEVFERYAYADCEVYANKPSGVLWNNDSCPNYVKDDEA